MKFKYNIKNNYYKMYGEANYFVYYKKKFLNDKKKRVGNYMNQFIFRYCLVILLMFIAIITNHIFYLLPLFILSFIYMFIIVVNTNNYKKYKNDNHKGTIIIDKNGITDKSDIEVTFPWNKVELIGITKDTLAIVLDSPFVIILEPNDKILNEIKKYKNFKIIDFK